jgi:hypothetical protein
MIGESPIRNHCHSEPCEESLLGPPCEIIQSSQD